MENINNDFFNTFLELIAIEDKETLKKIKLDSMQQAALTVNDNSVIAAGAGSGKTQVLATRFAWLILTDQNNEQINVEEILTLTFTKKAAAEMYQRIYNTLKIFEQSTEIDEEKRNRARKALNNFTNAHIQTLDSYCGKIVRQNAGKYGIRPDFTTGSSEASMDIKTKAFKFVLQNKDKIGIQKFAQPGRLQDFAENTFGAAIEKYTSLATDENFFQEKFKVQVSEALKAWNYYVLGKTEENNDFTPIDSKYISIPSILKNINEYEDKKTGNIKSLEDLKYDCSEDEKKVNYINGFSKLLEYEQLFSSLQPLEENDLVTLSDKLKNEINIVKKFFKDFKKFKKTYTIGKVSEINNRVKNIIEIQSVLYESLIVFVENYDAFDSLTNLFSVFLKEINSSKRKSGNLSFNDISEMSLKILIENEDVRNQEKRAFKRIMIDEFQDNNGKNRDLLYLLSLKDGAFEENGFPTKFNCNEPIIDQIINKDGDKIIDYRSPNKLFFVGDEKQSIYKFRGADVSVFNALTGEGNDLVSMTYNYRSSPVLVEAFNKIFSNGNGIFKSYEKTDSQKENFEAYYDNDAKAKNDETAIITADNVPIHINLLKNFKDTIIPENEYKTETELYVSEKEQVAFNIAKKIYNMGKENKDWEHFAILEKSRTDASVLTKYLNIFGIPYSIDQFSDIFEEGIINDFYNFFRLCVYPYDTLSYAAYLTSPFCGISENAAEIVLSYCVKYADELNIPITDIDFTNFPEEFKDDINKLNPNYYDKFISAIDFYKENKKTVLKQRITTTLSYLWNTKGYKYETYLSEKSQLISEHFDMLFELGRQTDESGKNLSWFVDQLAISQNQYTQEDPDIDIKDISYPIEKNNAVQIMTIHKSKGLEFHHVFIYGCVSPSSPMSNLSVFYDEKTGISIKPDTGEKNYFSLIGQEKYKEEEIAEFRRLIYVAITRAEKSVYIYGNWTSPDSKDSKDSDDLSFKLIENIIIDSYYKPGEPPLEAPAGEAKFIKGNAFDYTVIKPIKYENLVKDSDNESEKSVDEQREYAIEKTSSIYDESNADILDFVSIPPYEHKTPSSLEPSLEDREEKTSNDVIEENDLNKKISTIVPSKIPYNDFGTIAHAYQEAQVNNVPIDKFQPDYQLIKNLQPGDFEILKEVCFEMCSNFKESSLGIALEKTKEDFKNNVPGAFYRAEWGFKLVYKVPENNDHSKSDIFTGSMDLIFSRDDGLYSIVDYKTDKNINPENYIGQQHCYRAAAAELLGVPEEKISLYLYYLRYNKIVPLD